MNSEQVFWLAVIVILNVVAYCVGKIDGIKQGRNNTIEILKVVAPKEMQVIADRFESLDVFALAHRMAKEQVKGGE